jgi:hypothetical protein
VQEMPRVDGASLGAASVEVDGDGPQPRDDTGGSLRDLVMRGASFSVPGSAAPCDAVPTLRPSSAIGPGVSRLLLPASPGFLPTGGGWRTTRSSCVHRSPPWRGCCTRR